MTSTAKASVRGRVGRASLRRVLRGLGLIVVLTAAAIGLALWTEDRPLRTIEQALDRREYDRALVLANQYLGEYSGRSRALDQKARALAGLERWSDAARLFDQIGADSTASQRAWSQALLHEERWTEALPLLQVLDASSADGGTGRGDPEILHELAACESHLGYYDEAARTAERLMHLSGMEDRGRLLLGMMHYKRGNNRLAIEAWQPLFERNPEAAGLQVTPAEFLEAFGRALLNDGKAAQARRPLERAVALEAAADSRDALAEACEELGDLPAAVALWRQVVAAEPSNRTAREGLARAALEDRAAGEARQWLEPLLSSGELQSSTAYLMQRAATLSGDKASAARWEERVKTLRKREQKLNALDHALRDSPRSYWSRALRAHRFAREGNPYQALVVAEELLKENPEHAFVQQLVEALHTQGELPALDLIPLDQF